MVILGLYGNCLRYMAIWRSAHYQLAYYGEIEMALSAERKEEIIKDYALSDGDTGSPEVQVAL